MMAEKVTVLALIGILSWLMLYDGVTGKWWYLAVNAVFFCLCVYVLCRLGGEREEDDDG